MKKSILLYCKPLFVGASLLLILIPLLAACGGGDLNAIGAVSGDTSQAVLSHSQSILGQQPCPEKVKSPSYWDKIIGTHGDARVESVVCGKIMIYTGIQALVTVRHHSVGSIADVYVYADVLSEKPAQFFSLQGLYKGSARISGYNTVLTAEVDRNSSINKGKPLNSLIQDLFREFKWSDGAGAFEQTFFPGMYPDLTRFQGEADQARVNAGHDLWKLDARNTAVHFAVALFDRNFKNPVTLLSGGGPHDVSAVVRVEPPVPGAGVVPTIVTLSRLEGNTSGGIWEVIAAQAENFSITSPMNGARISSPVKVTGTGPAFEGVVGEVDVLDHLYNKIARARATVANQGDPFSVNVSYTASFKDGYQEGIIALFDLPASGQGTAPVMEKALISA